MMHRKGPTAEQETAARTALDLIFAGLANEHGKLAVAMHYNHAACIIEAAPQEMTGKIGRTRAFADFRQAVKHDYPEVLDVRPVTKNHPGYLGFQQNAGVALYLKEPTPARRLGVWLQC
jgi:hypothetical protein